MLKLKHSHHIELPHLSLPTSPMQLSPVPIDNDELVQDIENDPATHDDVWELAERPEMGELTQFWESVEADVQNDPEWFRFND